MADEGFNGPRRVLFRGHSFVARFQRHCDTRGITNMGLDPQLVSFVAMGRLGACLSFVAMGGPGAATYYVAICSCN